MASQYAGDAAAPALTHYRPSGIVPWGGLMLAGVVGPLVAVVCGFVNAYLFYYIPFVYLNFLLTAGFGAVVGFTVAVTVKLGFIRSDLVAGLLAAWSMAVGYYAYWGAYAWAVHGVGLGLSAWRPSTLLEFAGDLFVNGSWGIGRDNVTGWFLVAFWLAEAAVLFGVTFLFICATASQPFCECCQEWIDDETGVALFAATGDEEFWQAICRGQWNLLEQVPLVTAPTPQYVRLDLACCPSCDDSNYLTLQKVLSVRDDKGEESTTETELLSRVAVTADEVEYLRSLPEIAPFPLD